MKPLRIFLFISVFLFLFSPTSAFEDTFQYYTTGTFTTNDAWGVYAANAKQTNTILVDGDATYSRSAKLYSTATHPTHGTGYIVNSCPFSSSYVSFNLRNCTGHVGNKGYNDAWVRVQLADANYNILMTHVLINDPWPGDTWPHGFYEYIISGTDITLRVDGVDQGVKASGVTESIAYIVFETYAYDNYVSNDPWVHLIVDDVTTTGDIVGIGSESTTHTITESNLNPTNISFSLNSFPFATYSSTEYKVDVKRYNAGVLTSVASEVIKESGNSSVFTGFSNYNRSADLTNGDTAYGLYTVYLTGDGTNKDTNYFFLAPPGDASSISFSNSEIPIGTTETISYTIDAADFGSYSYHVRVYSTTEQIQSTQVSETSSAVSWDTTDEDIGLYYAVLSRTDKSSGAYIELIYDIATLSNDIVIHGHIYDAQNETVLDNVSVNFSQASTWYNTTSNATGYYELTGLIATVEINVNASLVNYTHENFTFTPLAAEIYTMNLYLINDTAIYGNTTIGGVVYDYPMHQAVPTATVNIYNSTWSDTNTSSSITGFYIFEELTNGSYTVNATKTEYLDSDEYSVDTNNGSWITQNILMYGIYDLTIRAQDATTSAYLSSFSVTYNNVVYSVTNGSLTLPNLVYGLYTISVSAEGYYSNS